MQTPSDAELAVLKLFWKSGPLSARELHDSLPNHLDWAVSTTRTVLDRMAAKGLLTRKSVHGLAVYSAAQDKVSVVGGVLKRMIRNVLEIDGALPVAAFSGSRLFTADELNALEKMLEDEEAKGEAQ